MSKKNRKVIDVEAEEKTTVAAEELEEEEEELEEEELDTEEDEDEEEDEETEREAKKRKKREARKAKKEAKDNRTVAEVKADVKRKAKYIVGAVALVGAGVAVGYYKATVDAQKAEQARMALGGSTEPLQALPVGETGTIETEAATADEFYNETAEF